jgi:prepilin-type N-terminal cleavage/methylation domain-containing protein/prepilin-type processing-associated H-X9-DG protein
MFNFSLASTALSLILSQSPPAPSLPTVDEVIASVRKAEELYAQTNLDLRFTFKWSSFRTTSTGQTEIPYRQYVSQTVLQDGKYRFKTRTEGSEKTGNWESGNEDIGFDGSTLLTKFGRAVQSSKNLCVSSQWEPNRPHGFFCGSIPFHVWLRGGDPVRQYSDGYVNVWNACDVKTQVVGRENVNGLECIRLRCVVDVVGDEKKGRYELGTYAIWLATARNYMPIQMKYVKATHREVMSHEGELNDLIEAQSGFWLPRRSVMTIHDVFASKRDKPVILYKHRFDVVSVDMKPRYPDDFFRNIVAEPPAPPEPPHVPQSPAEQFIFDLKSQHDAKIRNTKIMKWMTGIGIPLILISGIAYWWIRRRPLQNGQVDQFTHMRNHRAYTLIELLLVIAILGILIALLLSAVQKVREAASRTACQNNIRQLALALHHYHDAKGMLPAGIQDAKGKSKMAWAGWQVPLLPYVEQEAIYQEAISEFERDPIFSGSLMTKTFQHATLARPIKLYVCPSDGRIHNTHYYERFQLFVAFTSYLGNCGTTCKKADGLLAMDSKVRFADVTDGLSNTLLLGERPPSFDLVFGWWYAGTGQDWNGSAEMILGVREPNYGLRPDYPACPKKTYEFGPGRFAEPCDVYHYWSPHPGGAMFALADGSVRFMKYELNPMMPMLATRAGRETDRLPE